jgi:hypothetical protein
MSAVRTLQPRTVDLERVKPFRWAWDQRLLIGYLNLIVGDEGVGKGTFLAWLIARLTRGQLAGDLHGKPTRVLIVGDEDGFDSVIVPRLAAVDADLGMVLDLPVGPDGPLDVGRDAPALAALIKEHDIGAIVIDQLLDNLGLGVDNWRDKQVREALAPLRRLARELDIAPIASLHTIKAPARTFRERVAGTQQFNALARSSLLIAEHPEDTDRRVLLRGKGNYSQRPPALEFKIASRTVDLNGHHFDVGAVDALSDSTLTVDQVLGVPRVSLTKADQGRKLITETLADGEWHPAADVLARLADVEIGDREASRLATSLGVERKKSTGFPAHSMWRLARTPTQGDGVINLSGLSSRSGQSTPATPATPVDRRANGLHAVNGTAAA